MVTIFAPGIYTVKNHKITSFSKISRAFDLLSTIRSTRQLNKLLLIIRQYITSKLHESRAVLDRDHDRDLS